MQQKEIIINYNRGDKLGITLEKALLSDGQIIDIRDNYTYNLGHIPNANNIPYYNLLANHSHYLDKKNIYYLYCDYGKQSSEISNRLNSFGYNTHNIIGGYQEYIQKY